MVAGPATGDPETRGRRTVCGAVATAGSLCVGIEERKALSIVHSVLLALPVAEATAKIESREAFGLGVALRIVGSVNFRCECVL